jgi:hypothetical protein
MVHKSSEDDKKFMACRLGGKVYFWKEKITQMRRCPRDAREMQAR